MNFKLSDGHYAGLKWLISIVIPALIAFFGTVMNAFGWAHTELFLIVAVAFETLLGTIFKVAEINYDKDKESK